jgi:inositol-pentakisphosphate 2-kinase
VSKYSPLDLFSGNDEGIIKALVDLFETPQNNIRVFLEGVEVFGGSTDKLIASLEEKLAGVLVAPEGERVPAFQRLVASALNKSKALDQLLRVQKLDAYDIEGAILAYNKFMEMTDDAGQSLLFTVERYLERL